MPACSWRRVRSWRSPIAHPLFQGGKPAQLRGLRHPHPLSVLCGDVPGRELRAAGGAGQPARDRGLPARTPGSIGLMHNADDILLAEGDLGFLRDVFGEREQIYPEGRAIRRHGLHRQRRRPDRLLHRPGQLLSRQRSDCPAACCSLRACSAAAPARRSCRPRSRRSPELGGGRARSLRCSTSTIRSSLSTARSTTSMPASTATSSCRSCAPTSS